MYKEYIVHLYEMSTVGGDGKIIGPYLVGHKNNLAANWGA
jgi:hypothetical protein